MKFTLTSILVCLLFWGNGRQSFAAEPPIEAWKDSLAQTSEASSQLWYLSQLTKSLKHQHPAEALRYGKQGIQLARKIQDWSTLVVLQNLVAGTLRYQGENEKARKNLLNSILLQQDTLGWAVPTPYTFQSLALVHKGLGKLDDALTYQFEALYGYQKKGNQKAVANCQDNLGNLYRELGDFINALEFHEKALVIRRTLFPDELGYSYHSLGYVYQSMKRWDKAAEYYRRALDAKAGKGQARVRIELTYHKLGTVQIEKGDFQSGMENLFRSLKLAGEKEHTPLMVESHRILGRAYQLQYDRSSAEFHLERALELSKPEAAPLLHAKVWLALSTLYLDSRNLQAERARDTLFKAIKLLDQLQAKPLQIEACKALQQANQLLGKLSEALHWQIRALELKESLLAEQQKSLFKAHTAMLELHERKRELATLRQQKANESSNRWWSMVIVIVTILLSAMAFLLYRNRFQARSNQLLNHHNQQIASTNLALRNANVELEQFLYILSHDLKEPIRNIGGHISLLNRRYFKEVGAEGQVFIEFAMGGVRRLNQLITDLIQYAQVANEIPKGGLVSLDLVLKRVALKLDPLIEETGAELLIPTLPKIKADPRSMFELFSHLVENAIKFHHPDRTPEVGISYRWEAGKYIFSVRDNGIGINKAHQEKIFQLFQRLSPADYPEGTGIGLAIVRKVVNQHEGKLWLDSVPGEGTTFYLQFPDPNWETELSYDPYSGSRTMADSAL